MLEMGPTMRRAADNLFEVATVLTVGKREHQEDALVAEFPEGGGYGYAVLCDGMGGHAAGEVASAIVLETLAERLKERSADLPDFADHVTEVLDGAAETANARVRDYTRANPTAKGMGTTLIATVILQDQLYWLSIGDSPLYLFRDQELQQLNEDHSMAPQIDFMVANGLLSPELGATHPERSSLTSVILGRTIERIDCPEEPFRLEPGDVVLVSSDGLQFLSDQQIASILGAAGAASAEVIGQMLLGAIEMMDHPDQDNASFAVIRFGGLPETEEADDDVRVANGSAISANWTQEPAGPVQMFRQWRAKAGRSG